MIQIHTSKRHWRGSLWIWHQFWDRRTRPNTCYHYSLPSSKMRLVFCLYLHFWAQFQRNMYTQNVASNLGFILSVYLSLKFSLKIREKHDFSVSRRSTEYHFKFGLTKRSNRHWSAESIPTAGHCRAIRRYKVARSIGHFGTYATFSHVGIEIFWFLIFLSYNT